MLTSITVQPTFIERIKILQDQDEQLQGIKRRVEEGEQSYFTLREGKLLWYKDRLCVPDNSKIKK